MNEYDWCNQINFLYYFLIIQLPVLGTGEEKKPFSARLKQIKEMIRSKKESQAEALRPVVTRAGSEVDVKLDLSATGWYCLWFFYGQFI